MQNPEVFRQRDLLGPNSQADEKKKDALSIITVASVFKARLFAQY